MALLRLFVLNLIIAFTCQAFPLAVTFDDIPAAGDNYQLKTRSQVASEIMNSLKKHQVPGVYGFVNGKLSKNMEERLSILKEWKALGFFVGNHTFSHIGLSSVSTAEFISDIEANESLLSDYAATIAEFKVMRFPFLEEGESTEKRYAVRSYLNKRNYKIAQVTIDFEDWAWNPAFIRCSEKNDDKSLQKLKEGYLEKAIARTNFSLSLGKIIYGDVPIKHILLLHFTAATGEFLDTLLTKLKDSGAQFISLEEAMKDRIYQEDSTYIGSTGKTFLLQNRETRKIKTPSLRDPQIDREYLQKLCL